MDPRRSQEHFKGVPGVFQRVSRGYHETSGAFPVGPSVLEGYDVASDAFKRTTESSQGISGGLRGVLGDLRRLQGTSRPLQRVSTTSSSGES